MCQLGEKQCVVWHECSKRPALGSGYTRSSSVACACIVCVDYYITKYHITTRRPKHLIAWQVRERQFVKFVRSRLITVPCNRYILRKWSIILTMDENETVIVGTQNKVKCKTGRGGVNLTIWFIKSLWSDCSWRIIRAFHSGIYVGTECSQMTFMSSDRFKYPFTCIIGGHTGSGKSTFCIRFLQNLDALCTKPHILGGIIWCYSEQSAVPQPHMAVLRKNVQFTRVYPKIFKTHRAYRVSLFLMSF